MNPAKGHFSIVQYCPDLARRETVNIGVILLVPDRAYLQARMVADNDRVKHFFGIKGDDGKMLSAFKKSFTARIDAEQGRIVSLESLRKFIDTRGNQIQLTEPAYVKVRACEETIDQLFDQLVGGKVKSQKRVSLTKSLQARFDDEGLGEIVCKDITLPVPIVDLQAKITFGFQNGVFNLLQPVTFQAGKEEANYHRALKYSMEGKIFQEHPDEQYGELKFNVIGRFASKSDHSISIVKEVLAASDVRLHLEWELSELFEEIRRTGKPRTRNA